MKDLFKVLEFKNSEDGKYAHPIEVREGEYEWGSSFMPMLMTIDSSIRKLKQIYPTLCFDGVWMVTKILTDIDTVNT